MAGRDVTVRKGGLPPLFDERGQATLPDLFYSHLFKLFTLFVQLQVTDICL